MSQYLTATRLRVNLYRILDHIVESGETVELVRKGRRVRIVAQSENKLDLLRPHPNYLRGAPGEVVHMDWSDEWQP